MSAEVGFEAGPRIDALIRAVVESVAALIGAEYAQVHTNDLPAVGQRLEMVSRLIRTAQIEFADDVDQRGLAASLSCTSTRILLQQMLNIPLREAGARVRTARNIHAQDLPSGGETPARLPVLAAAVTAGMLDADHVHTVISTMKRLPATLDPETLADAEQALLAHAVELNPDQFRKVAHHLEEALNPDGTLDEREPLSRVEFHIGSRSAATGLTSITGKLDDLSVEVLRTAIDALSAPKPEVDGVRDQRPAAVRRAHALIDIFNQVITHGDLPAHGGERPHIIVTMNWDVLRERAGTAVTGNGATLTPATARRLLCDANVIPAIVNTDSEVLDLGRSARTFSRPIRRAIALRDHGCAFPGCDRPPGWCDAHHIDFWARDLGETNYQNGVLLCGYHHGEIHKNEWQIRRSADGTPEFIPPRWIDPDRRPRRNTVLHLAPTLQ